MISKLDILTICALLSCILSLFAILLATIALIKSIALEKSTHTVQFFDPNQEKDWATSEKEIDELNKEYSENTEDISVPMGI